MQKKKRFEFVGVLEEVRFNRIHSAVFLPHHIAIDIPRTSPRVSGTLNGIPFSLCILYRREVGKFIAVSRRLLTLARLEAGDPVRVCFRMMAMEQIEMPEVLETVLHSDDDARKQWTRLSRGEQQHLLNYMNAATNLDSRIRKVVELIRRARTLPVGEDRKSPLAARTRKKRNGRKPLL